jgi:hypothetical protein
MKKWHIWPTMLLIAIFMIVSTGQADDPPKIKKKVSPVTTSHKSLKAVSDSLQVPTQPAEIRRPGQPNTAACLKDTPPLPVLQPIPINQQPLQPNVPRIILKRDSVLVAPAMKKGAILGKEPPIPIRDMKASPRVKPTEKKKADK